MYCLAKIKRSFGLGGYNNVRAAYDEVSEKIQSEVYENAKDFVKKNKNRYDCGGYVYVGDGQDLGQFWAKLAVGDGKIQKSSSNTAVINGNDCYSLACATYGIYSDKGCTTATLKVSDTPKVTDTLIELFKIDMETGKVSAQGNASLEGAKFVWKYYDGYYTKDNLPSEPTRTWTTKTKAEKASDNAIKKI